MYNLPPFSKQEKLLRYGLLFLEIFVIIVCTTSLSLYLNYFKLIQFNTTLSLILLYFFIIVIIISIVLIFFGIFLLYRYNNSSSIRTVLTIEYKININQLDNQIKQWLVNKHFISIQNTEENIWKLFSSTRIGTMFISYSPILNVKNMIIKYEIYYNVFYPINRTYLGISKQTRFFTCAQSIIAKKIFLDFLQYNLETLNGKILEVQNTPFK